MTRPKLYSPRELALALSWQSTGVPAPSGDFGGGTRLYQICLPADSVTIEEYHSDKHVIYSTDNLHQAQTTLAILKAYLMAQAWKLTEGRLYD